MASYDAFRVDNRVWFDARIVVDGTETSSDVQWPSMCNYGIVRMRGSDRDVMDVYVEGATVPYNGTTIQFQGQTLQFNSGGAVAKRLRLNDCAVTLMLELVPASLEIGDHVCIRTPGGTTSAVILTKVTINRITRSKVKCSHTQYRVAYVKGDEDGIVTKEINSKDIVSTPAPPILTELQLFMLLRLTTS